MIIINSYTLKNGGYPAGARMLCAAINGTLQNSLHPPNKSINWGCQVQNKTEVLNGNAPIPKLQAFKLLQEKNIPIPEFKELGDWIVRRHVHAQGRDILRAEDAFLVKAITKKREARVDVWKNPRGNYKAFRLHLKEPLNPGTFVWNRDNTTWRSYGPRTMVEALRGNREPLTLAKQSLEALDYHFGAVDLIQDTNDNWFVLEVNSAPNLKETGADKYAERLKEYFNAAE